MTKKLWGICKMNLIKTISYIQLKTGNEITKKKFSQIVGVTEQALQAYRKDENKDIPEAWVLKLVEEYGNIFPSSDINVVESAEKSIVVPYWSCGKPEVNSKIRNENYTEFTLDLQFVIDKKLKPENLVVVAAMGEEMNGEFYPIKNKDILLVDTSRNDINESGIFFCTSNQNSCVYIRRIIEIMNGGIYAKTTVDNKIYREIFGLEKSWTIEDWEEADIKVIGRVIKNMSYMC